MSKLLFLLLLMLAVLALPFVVFKILEHFGYVRILTGEEAKKFLKHLEKKVKKREWAVDA